MAESAAYARRTFKGGAALAHIPGGLAAGVTGVVAADDLSTWAGATANGPTRAMVNRLGTTPEEIEISSISGNSFTVAARGLQGTADTDHDANATIEIIASPRDFDEANRLVSKILGAITGNALKIFRVNSGATDVEAVALTGCDRHEHPGWRETSPRRTCRPRSTSSTPRRSRSPAAP
jgi:hypothetical protein